MGEHHLSQAEAGACAITFLGYKFRVGAIEMNPVQKFDEVSKQFRARVWFQHTYSLCKKHTPIRTEISTFVAWHSVPAGLVLGITFLSQGAYLYLYLFVAFSLLFLLAAYIYHQALVVALKQEYSLKNASLASLSEDAKLQILKKKLLGELGSKNKIGVIATLKEYLENSLAYPVGGVVLRHPLFISIVITLPISLTVVVSAPIIRDIVKHLRTNKLKCKDGTDQVH